MFDKFLSKKIFDAKGEKGMWYWSLVDLLLRIIKFIYGGEKNAWVLRFFKRQIYADLFRTGSVNNKCFAPFCRQPDFSELHFQASVWKTVYYYL